MIGQLSSVPTPHSSRKTPFLADTPSGRGDDRPELDGAQRHAGCLGTFGRCGRAGLLLGLKHLDRDPLSSTATK